MKVNHRALGIRFVGRVTNQEVFTRAGYEAMLEKQL